MRIKPWSEMIRKKNKKQEEIQILKEREKIANYLFDLACGKSPQEAMKELEKKGKPRWMKDYSKETEKNLKNCKNCSHPRNDHRINVEAFKDMCNIIENMKQCACRMYLSPEK